MADRGTCWSITLNNPTDEEMHVIQNPPAPGWRLQGQLERGAEGTLHYQGMLTTPQVRFSAVKKVYHRAHIEKARNKKALETYVRKEETRVAEVHSQAIPSIFEYQGIIAKQWRDADYQKWREVFPRKDMDEVAMFYLDSLVAADIAKGRRGPEWIATNPMWRNAWKKFWRVIIERENAAATQSEPTGEADQAADEASPPSDGLGGCEDLYGDRGN